MKFNSIRDIATLGLVVLALSVSGISKAGGFSQIYIFGDSLSDPGNIYTLTGETSKAPYLPIPEAAYAIGGHQFSNGKTWAQRFAQNMNLNNGGKAALDAPGKNGNYAFGGARARTSGNAPTASVQVGMFDGDYDMADSEALYVVQFGGNDVRDALFAGLSDPNAAIGIVLEAAEAIKMNIVSLHSSGARKFLVVNSPNLAHAPAVPAFARSSAEELSSFYNFILDLGLTSIKNLDGISIHQLDLFSLINDAVAMPENFGLTDTDSACLEFFTKNDAKCDNPEEYLFWDGIHPTATMHNAVGNFATSLFNDE